MSHRLQEREFSLSKEFPCDGSFFCEDDELGAEKTMDLCINHISQMPDELLALLVSGMFAGNAAEDSDFYEALSQVALVEVASRYCEMALNG